MSGRWLWCRCVVLTRRANIDFFLFLLTSSAHPHTHTHSQTGAWCLRRSIVWQQLKGFVYNWESEKKMTATAFSAHGNSSSSSSCSCWRRVRIHRAMRCWTPDHNRNGRVTAVNASSNIKERAIVRNVTSYHDKSDSRRGRACRLAFIPTSITVVRLIRRFVKAAANGVTYKTRYPSTRYSRLVCTYCRLPPYNTWNRHCQSCKMQCSHAARINVNV